MIFFRDCVDLLAGGVHIRGMDFDISHLLEQWDYQPGQVVVRRFKAKDGQEKIQLRVDLGLLQMNAEGRPDGKRPFGYTSLLEQHQARLYKHLAAQEGSAEGFKLTAEDCAKLQLEALQYHHRYICLLQLEDYAGVIRDAERNLAVFDFVTKYAESEELAWALRQFQPQLLMILTRARAAQALKADDFNLAIQLVEEGLEQIRNFFRETGNPEAAEQSGELMSLEDWLEEIRTRRPLSQRERLERALSEAVKREDYERAAKVRDELRNLKSAE
ncbi:MAG TPA: UvrB/UvrC motif-containing protein [Clostridia bacterium]|nr:UvrB/UvrC motif-containing protein [Clostridia bacterium]